MYSLAHGRVFCIRGAFRVSLLGSMSAPLSIAFIGTGVMGRSMAGHLQKAGHTLHVFNRTKEKAQSLVDAGATWHDSAGAAAAVADVVITILGFPTDVETTYLAAG